MGENKIKMGENGTKRGHCSEQQTEGIDKEGKKGRACV